MQTKKTKGRFLRLGSVLKSDKNGFFMVLGNNKNKDPKYNLNVEVIVRDNDGKVVAQLENPLIGLNDPRKRPNITEEQASRIPEKLRFELSLRLEE